MYGIDSSSTLARFWLSIVSVLIALAAASSCVAIDGHWAFQPLKPPVTARPEARAPSESRNSVAAIDQLLDTARRAAGIKAVGKADRVALCRRVYFDLVGLPPSVAELNNFLSDQSPAAFAQLVDALLARLDFGERWGRHWLDVARYADSNGCSIEANNTYDNAWRYRDYVIAAMNRDKPFDRFVVEQIAGDLLPWVTDTERSEHLVATGFLLLGPKAFGTGNFDQLRLDTIDDQIDTVGKALLGMTLGCARCHDHKLEPVTTEDYYALAGIFGSTVSVRREAGWRSNVTWNRAALPVLDEPSAAALVALHQQRLEDAKSGKLSELATAELQAARETLATLRKRADTDAQLLKQARLRLAKAKFEKRNADRAAKVLPIVSPVPVAMAVVDLDEPRNEPVRIGGVPHEKDDAPQRRVWSLPGQQRAEAWSIPDGESGRLQLAHWLVDTTTGVGELTARVAVNRIWLHLMGQAIVETVDNFGLSGSQPTHPELLEQLARSFIDHDWSTKSLVRQIVLSDAYQLSALPNAAAYRIDPNNQLYWRRLPRRQDAEALRDALLLISGQLDRARGGKTLQHLGLISIPSDMIDLDTPSPYARRSVYLPAIRDAVGVGDALESTAVMMEMFDGANPNLVCGARDSSTRPGQALFLMNSHFVTDSARSLAKSLAEIESSDQRVDELFRRVLLRGATKAETEQSLELVGKLNAATGEQGADLSAGWTGLCQVLLTCNEFLFLQ